MDAVWLVPDKEQTKLKVGDCIFIKPGGEVEVKSKKTKDRKKTKKVKELVPRHNPTDGEQWIGRIEQIVSGPINGWGLQKVAELNDVECHFYWIFLFFSGGIVWL